MTPKKVKALPRGWKPRFLSEMASGATVKEACEHAKVSRQAAYQQRARDDDFAQAWGDAEELGTDVLEAEAFRRAVDGVERPVFYQGEEVATVTEYSNTLLIFLLKGRRPEKYRERFEHEISGVVTHELPLLEGREPLEISAAARRKAARALLGDGVKSNSTG